jgi:hypothetical protein
MRQLYIACVITIAEYGTPIWWNFQKQYIDQFTKLQNSALRKMLEIFKIMPISIMEIEPAIAPILIKLEKYCKNYAIRILQLNSSHPIRKKKSKFHINFPLLLTHQFISGNQQSSRIRTSNWNILWKELKITIQHLSDWKNLILN